MGGLIADRLPALVRALTVGDGKGNLSKKGLAFFTVLPLGPIKKGLGGKIKIGIYRSEGFLVMGKEAERTELEVKKSSFVSYCFKNIPAGPYAIAVFQDKNNDGKLNKNLFGAPKEPYGFSNNKYGRFGPPEFEDVCFEVKENKSVFLTIHLSI